LGSSREGEASDILPSGMERKTKRTTRRRICRLGHMVMEAWEEKEDAKKVAENPKDETALLPTSLSPSSSPT
jgi:hypothetical protein